MSNIFKSANRNITTESTFNDLELYANSKSSKGFYVDILNKIEELLMFSLVNFTDPKVSHFTIDEPNQDKLQELRKDLARFLASRAKTKGTKETKFLYLATLEIRPKNKQEHLHLAFFFDGLNTKDLNLLEERLAKFSNSNKAKLNHRRLDCLPLDIYTETGEIKYNKRGNFARKGSTAWHELRTDSIDAFKRLSYLAKVYSKAKDYHLSSSRLPSKLAAKPFEAPAASLQTKSIPIQLKGLELAVEPSKAAQEDSKILAPLDNPKRLHSPVLLIYQRQLDMKFKVWLRYDLQTYSFKGEKEIDKNLVIQELLAIPSLYRFKVLAGSTEPTSVTPERALAILRQAPGHSLKGRELTFQAPTMPTGRGRTIDKNRCQPKATDWQKPSIQLVAPVRAHH
ncbi:hypothetical protein [Roseateles albus]|uniref:Uncharacterized protein n=1 Tax=Roseateles albus TaxID=2987525 RepID=A0ABT5KGD5_9BURK|nr:hypothetical protein [Roseateles albus]MDC8772457.1 hypothetical protein [Roseateles albus]